MIAISRTGSGSISKGLRGCGEGLSSRVPFRAGTGREGHIALVEDPEGNVIGIWEPRMG